MARTTPEWTGKHDDAAIPPAVKLRLWSKCGGFCQSCTRKILAGEPKHFDHIVPLADGGRHAEGTLQVLCKPCHAEKTGIEATERAAVRSKAKAILGIKAKPKQSIPSRPAPTKPARDKLPVPGFKKLFHEVQT